MRCDGRINNMLVSYPEIGLIFAKVKEEAQPKNLSKFLIKL